MPRRVCLLSVLCVLSCGAWADLVGIDFGPPGSSPANWTSVSAAGNYQHLNDDNGQPTRVSLNVRQAGTPYSVQPRPDSVPAYKGNLAAIDGNQYQFGGTFEAEISGLRAHEPYKVYIFGLRGGAPLTQGVALSGGRGDTLAQKAPDSALAINDQIGSSQRPLSSYARTMTASPNGTIGFNLTGGSRANQTFAIAGLAIEGDFPRSSTAADAPRTAQADATEGRNGAAIAGSGTTPAARSEPVGPDVIGIYLGMPMDEAFAVIRNTYPEMPLKRFQWWLSQVQKSRIRGGPKYEAGFQGKYNAQERNEQLIVMSYMPPNDAKVAGISRYTYTGEMLLPDLRASLVDKYGEPYLEIPAGTVLRKPYHLYSWSLTRDGKPQKDPLAVTNCVYQQMNNPWEGSAPVTLWDTEEAFNGSYDACGLTFAVAVLETRQNPPIIRGFGTVLYDLNEIRKTARQAWEETDRMAAQWEEEKASELSGKKPVL